MYLAQGKTYYMNYSPLRGMNGVTLAHRMLAVVIWHDGGAADVYMYTKDNEWFRMCSQDSVQLEVKILIGSTAPFLSCTMNHDSPSEKL